MGFIQISGRMSFLAPPSPCIHCLTSGTLFCQYLYPRLPLLSLPNADGPISSYVSNTQYSCCVLSTHIDLKTGMELLPNLHDKMNMNADRKASRSLGGEVVNALLLLL